MDMTIFCPDCDQGNPVKSTKPGFTLICVNCERRIQVVVGERLIVTSRIEATA